MNSFLFSHAQNVPTLSRNWTKMHQCAQWSHLHSNVYILLKYVAGNIIFCFLFLFQSNAVKRSDAQNVPTLSRNRTNSVSSITSGSSFGSSNSGDGASCGGLSHSSNEDGSQPPRRAALLHDRSRYSEFKFIKFWRL